MRRKLAMLLVVPVLAFPAAAPARGDALSATLRHAGAWQSCYPMPLGSSSRCVSRPELFAEQFAFWATGARNVRTSYSVPPLAARHAFSRLMELLTR